MTKTLFCHRQIRFLTVELFFEKKSKAHTMSVCYYIWFIQNGHVKGNAYVKTVLKVACSFAYLLIKVLWKHLAEYGKLSPSGTFRNRNFGVKHSFLSNNAFFI